MATHVSRRLIQLSIAGILAGFSASSFASGFQLFEVNGAGTGDFYASGAANANDASAAFFNPAALVTMKNSQIQLSGVNIFSRINFTGRNTYTSFGTVTQTGSAQGGGYHFIPSIEAAGPFNDEIAWGFSVAVPFGLNTDYDNNSFLRYAATETAVQVIDTSPSIGFKITDKLAFGIGFDADRISATFNSVSGVPAFGPSLDTLSDNTGSGWGYGWHAGLLYQFTPGTRMGFEYRSPVSFNLSGTSSFTGSLAGGATLTNDNLYVDTTLPATSILSAYHQFNPQWAGEATLSYTQWSVFNCLILNNVQSTSPTAPITVNVPQKFRNTWRVALGGTYQPFKQWLFRAGLGWDETPTIAAARSVRLPDGNRFVTALGAHYQATKALGVDVGWTHLFFNNGAVSVTQQVGTSTSTTVGTAESSADLVGLQLTWDFV
ncbi:MAG: outer membrane protein transport protein [Gammaproteobacteria bacterium]|nr:outer membrane protein transport protein [Gammaproteobacteria bacterium]